MLAKEGATSSDEISSLSPQNYENRCESHMSWADIDAHHQTAYSTHTHTWCTQCMILSILPSTWNIFPLYILSLKKDA